MTDEVDRANDDAERYLAERLRDTLRAGERLVPPLGWCMNCEADLGGRTSRRFCDPDCAADWQHEQTILRRQGGV